ncbi:MAG: hypothetical protein Q7S40_30040 [Opitutaceae bacterium]|nr:hypothetical protein [Opitutaceae bacterium]
MATTTLAGSGFAAEGSGSGGSGASPRQPSLIRSENARAGTTDWQLTRVRVVPGEGNTPQEAYRSVAIEGYCSRQSVAAGETIELMISTNPPARYGVEIFRTGYYGGRGARLITTLGPFQGAKQPEPPVGEGRVRECRWAPSVSFKIAADWPSGVYLGRLTTQPEKSSEPYWQSYVVFIVRDERPVDILFQCSDNTWQAYNRWPGTYSLYDDGSAGMTTKRNIAASFDRPYGKYRQIYDNPMSTGSGEFLCWEFPLSYWLEQHGYDVAYCSNSDMLTPDRGLKCKCFVSIGHDEYWDVRQYHSVKAMIDAGVNALFLTGNAVSGVTPFTPSSDGRPNRIITRVASYGGWGRSRAGAPAAPADNQVEPGPDEGLLMGARNVSPVNGGGDWIVTKPNHWIFEGTGMKSGDRIPGLVGWEYHGNPADIPGLEVVAEGTAWKSGTVPQHWTATVHPGPRKNFVFNAATIFWAQGLSRPPGHMPPWSHWNRPHGPDERVQRIARNLLERALTR